MDSRNIPDSFREERGIVFFESCLEVFDDHFVIGEEFGAIPWRIGLCVHIASLEKVGCESGHFVLLSALSGMANANSIIAQIVPRLPSHLSVVRHTQGTIPYNDGVPDFYWKAARDYLSQERQ